MVDQDSTPQEPRTTQDSSTTTARPRRRAASRPAGPPQGGQASAERSDASPEVKPAAKKATAAQRSMATAEDSAMMSKLAETDVRIVTLTDSERGAFAAAVAQAPVVHPLRSSVSFFIPPTIE